MLVRTVFYFSWRNLVEKVTASQKMDSGTGRHGDRETLKERKAVSRKR